MLRQRVAAVVRPVALVLSRGDFGPKALDYAPLRVAETMFGPRFTLDDFDVALTDRPEALTRPGQGWRLDSAWSSL